jgi:hypothetical protein
MTSTLPPMLRNRICESCFQASECMTYHASIEKGTEGTSGVPALFQHLTQHLTQSQIDYFSHWDQLIALEANLSEQNPMSRLWGSDSDSDDPLSHLIVTSISQLTTSSGPLIEGTFSPSIASEDLQNCQHFHIGDSVHVSVLKASHPLSHSCSDGHLTEIEDLPNISKVDPFVAVGAIVSITQHHLTLSFTEITPRFKRFSILTCLPI